MLELWFFIFKNIFSVKKYISMIRYLYYKEYIYERTGLFL